MQLDQVAVQLYTVREHLTTLEDYQASLQKIADIGYRSVEMAGPRPVSEAEIAALCAEKGLAIASTHEESKLILDEPEQALENVERFGCRYVVYPYPGGIDMGSESAVEQLTRQLNAAGALMREAGKVLAYHNHDIELKPLQGHSVLSRIYAQTAAANLQAELDTYWLHIAEESPAAWCASLRDRLPLMHLKDCRMDESGTPQFAEVGSGILDFKTIIATAEASGCQWFIVEQDTCPGDPFVSIEESFRYIYDHLVERD
jgi:sugar phosphate isomerase/epimerase